MLGMGGAPKILLKHYNVHKYKGQPPSVELVREVLAKSGMKRFVFERIYDIRGRALVRYLEGILKFPAQYWHLIYEYDRLKEYYREVFGYERKQKKTAKKKAPVKKIPSHNKSTIDDYRQRLAQ